MRLPKEKKGVNNYTGKLLRYISLITNNNNISLLNDFKLYLTN